MFLFASPISVNISEVFVYFLPIRSFPDSPKYRADPISDPVIGFGRAQWIRCLLLFVLSGVATTFPGGGLAQPRTKFREKMKKYNRVREKYRRLSKN